MDLLDQYAAFTDLTALKAASSRKLRQSIRVNTVKMSVKELEKRAAREGWTLTPVPWCPEGFFVEHGGEREDVGRSLLHRLGMFYVQEAASMLPATLLDPKPGDSVLDLCAAPGSKTTQIAAMIFRSPPHPSTTLRTDPNPLPPAGREGGNFSQSKVRHSDLSINRSGAGVGMQQGVIVANDPQEKRLWILRSNLQRCGVMNVIVTKKVGQWFAKNMAERFDRVLCDAPCSAQGNIRSSPKVLERSHPAGIAKLVRLQEELLEAAVHATKIGGTIVYSTCTLTPEENEGVVLKTLNKFLDQLEIIDPRVSDFGQLIQDSFKVQEFLRKSAPEVLGPTSSVLIPMLRVWPQTFDTEGFFCAVLRKRGRTKEPSQIRGRTVGEEYSSPTESRTEDLRSRFGTSFLAQGDQLLQNGERLDILSQDAAEFALPIKTEFSGLPFGKVQEGKLRLSHEIVTLRGEAATKNVLELQKSDLGSLLRGQKIACSRDLAGDTVLRFDGLTVGLGTAGEGRLQSRFPKAFLQ